MRSFIHHLLLRAAATTIPAVLCFQVVSVIRGIRFECIHIEVEKLDKLCLKLEIIEPVEDVFRVAIGAYTNSMMTANTPNPFWCANYCRLFSQSIYFLGRNFPQPLLNRLFKAILTDWVRYGLVAEHTIHYASACWLLVLEFLVKKFSPRHHQETLRP
jgi:hypothetical protein